MKQILVLLTFLLLVSFIYAQELYELWDDILRESVSYGKINDIELTVVDYPHIQNMPQYSELLDNLSKYNLSDLENRDEKLVFWINVYNIAAIKMIIDNYPLKSIRRAGNIFRSVWDRDVIDIGGEKYTLGHIEHEILRKYDEPRIHFAIVCASVSCPDLIITSYRVETIDQQLTAQTVSFLRNSGKGAKIDPESKILSISQIFKWFESDFGGRDGVINFINSHLVEDYSTYKIRYLNYDWDLNVKGGR